MKNLYLYPDPNLKRSWAKKLTESYFDDRHRLFSTPTRKISIWTRLANYPGRLRRALGAAREAFSDNF